MKFDNIKKKIATHVFSTVLNHPQEFSGELGLVSLLKNKRGDFSGGHATQKEVAKNLHDYIMSWDIRMYKSLLDLFPTIIKKRYTTIELTDNGWELN